LVDLRFSTGSAMATWCANKAKAWLSEALKDYLAVTRPSRDFKTYLLSGPKFDDFEIERDLDTGRTIEF
jgi:hypothetical protein